jgi:type II secretory pathway pseudopilin PulG
MTAMLHIHRTDMRTGLTVLEVVVLVLIVAALAAALLPALARRREEARRIRCRNNLNQLGRGMVVYLSEHGDSRWFPCPLGRGVRPDDYNGAEWLAALYWTRVIPDPGLFVCPSTTDTNHNGADLGTRHAIADVFGPRTISYAGMHYQSDSQEPGAIPDDYPPDKPMASDDTQGDVNHGTLRNGGMAVRFFDSHVEFRTNTELDLRRAVGQEGGLLEELRN